MRGAAYEAALRVEPIRQAEAEVPDGAPVSDVIQAIAEGVRMDFGTAVWAMRNGARVARSAWDDGGMWLALCEGARVPILDGSWHITLNVNLDPFIVMSTAGGTFIPWLASQADMLATDWSIVQ